MAGWRREEEGLFPSMAKPESLLPARRQGINYNHMAGLQDGFMKAAPFNMKPGSPPKSPGRTKALIFPVLPVPLHPHRLTPLCPPPRRPFKASRSSNCNPDMNSNLKIISDHPFPPTTSGEGIQGVPFPIPTLIAGDCTLEERTFIRKLV